MLNSLLTKEHRIHGEREKLGVWKKVLNLRTANCVAVDISLSGWSRSGGDFYSQLYYDFLILRNFPFELLFFVFFWVAAARSFNEKIDKVSSVLEAFFCHNRWRPASPLLLTECLQLRNNRRQDGMRGGQLKVFFCCCSSVSQRRWARKKKRCRENQ